MKPLVVIPARFASSRFPGKVLAPLQGRPVIEHVMRAVEKADFPLIVATDNQQVADYVSESGRRIVMTSPDHSSGTERVAEAISLVGDEAEIIINVQADEPFLTSRQIATLGNLLETDPEVGIATLGRPFGKSLPVEMLENPNLVKVVTDEKGRALMFSRSVIPFLRDIPRNDWPSAHPYLIHVGMYAFRRETLKRVVALPAGPLEQAERLEQLRWLAAGEPIKVGITHHIGIGIDTPEDLALAEQIYTHAEKPEL